MLIVALFLVRSPKVVSVSHIDDLGHFFVQYKDMWDLIDELQENLQSVQVNTHCTMLRVCYELVREIIQLPF